MYSPPRGFLALAAVAFMLAAVAASPADATPPPGQKSTGDSHNVSLTARWAHGRSVAVYCDGPWLYLGRGALVQLWDVSNPADPLLRREYLMPSLVTHVQIWGNYLVVGTSSDGVQVYDVTDPLTAIFVTAMGSHSVSDVYCFSNYFYVACGEVGLRVYDHHAFETEPTLLDSYSGSVCNSVWLHNMHLYMAAGLDGFKVFEVGNYVDPPVATLAMSYAADIDVRNDVAWVAARSSGVVAIDVSDPTAPAILGTCNTHGSANQLVAHLDAIYVADGQSGIGVVDPVSPTAPVILDWYDTSGHAKALALWGDVVYLADSAGGLCIFDVTDPAAIALITTEPGLDNATAIAYDPAGTAYVGCSSSGIVSLDMTDITTPTDLSRLDTIGNFVSLELVGDLLYATANWPGLVIYDVSDPAAPAQAGEIVAPHATAVSVTGNMAYVACQSYGVYKIDVANPAAPVLVDIYDSAGQAYGVLALGDDILVADGSNGLVVVDFLAQGGPSQTAHLDTPGSARKIAYAAPHVYVADSHQGLRIIDWGTDPVNPIEVAHVNLPGYAYDVEVFENTVYVACHNAGLYVVDVTDPTAPVVSGWFDTGGLALELALAPPYILVADDSDGVWILHDDVITPVHLAAFDAVRTPFGARVRWSVTDADPGTTFRVWRDDAGHRSPVSPVLPVAGRDHAVDDPTVPAAATAYWLEETTPQGAVFWHGPTPLPAASTLITHLAPALPNPFNPRTTLGFTMAQASHARLTIYDLQGRHVRTLVDGDVAAGEHRRVWDGRDGRGRDAPAGTYLMRLETADRVASEKLSLVR